MSLLDSVMASIGDPAKAPPKTKPMPRSTTSANTGRVVKPGGQPGRPASEINLKRKAEDQATSQHLKIARQPALGPSSASPSRGSTASPVPRTKPPVAAPTSQAYKGTGRPSSTPPVTAKPADGPKAGPTTQPRAQPAAGAPAPKKGYLAILERAKAAQEAAKPFGQIKHQKKEKERLSSKARARLAEEAAAASKQEARSVGSPAKAAARGAGVSTFAGKPQEVKKKTVDVGYKGTMRPAPSTYQGTMGRGGSAKQPSRPTKDAGGSAPRRYRYAEDSEEDDEEDEDMDDYDSASSDMEAGIDDIDREELMSARQARQEDEEALREENEHKRQKLERQRKLQALNAAAAKKKKIY